MIDEVVMKIVIQRASMLEYIILMTIVVYNFLKVFRNEINMDGLYLRVSTEIQI